MSRNPHESTGPHDSAGQYSLRTVQLAVAGLGFPEGAALEDIFERAIQLGLEFCPLELGPQLRLQYRDQPEGYRGMTPRYHESPPGALVVASRPISNDDEFPKGFYLRKIKGLLWLRGYRASLDAPRRADREFLFVASAPMRS